MDESNVSIFNLKGGVNIKNKISFGAYFKTSINKMNPQSDSLSNIHMDCWSAGGLVGYTGL